MFNQLDRDMWIDTVCNLGHGKVRGWTQKDPKTLAQVWPPSKHVLLETADKQECHQGLGYLRFAWLKNPVMDWLDWHLLCQIVTEPNQSLQIFPPFCSLVSLLMPARWLLCTTGNQKNLSGFLCFCKKSLKKSRGIVGQNLEHKSSLEFPSNYWHNAISTVVWTKDSLVFFIFLS